MLPELSVAPETVQTAEGIVHVWVAKPGLVFTRAEGRILMAHGQLIMDMVDAAARARPKLATVVHDFTAVASYEIALHVRMSTWSVGLTPSMRRVVVAVNSPLVALAVRTVNLASGGKFELLETREQAIEAARRELAQS
jgi:hypothetical protein